MEYNHKISPHIKHLIKTSDEKHSYKFYSVYYVNCDINPNFMSWVSNQIELVKNFSTEIHICVTTSKKENKTIIIDFVKNQDYNHKVNLYFNQKNMFEYPGIKKVYDISKKINSSTNIILYFHSKGITRYDNYKPQEFYEKMLNDINLIENIFNKFPSINKIGDRCGGNGWCWYNFWFARSSYIANLVEPIITERRHYYEDWLGRLKTGKENLLDCYSLYSEKNEANIGRYYCPNFNVILNVPL